MMARSPGTRDSVSLKKPLRVSPLTREVGRLGASFDGAASGRRFTQLTVLMMGRAMSTNGRLQWQDAGTLYHPDGGNWSKARWEAEASWGTPLGPGRYRITHETGTRDDRDFWSVVRLKPTNGTLPNGRPKKFSGYALQGLTMFISSFAEAKALAEADNARLASKS